MQYKSKKEPPSKESLAPANLISSLLVGFPFLGVVTILDVTSHKTSFVSSITLVSLLLSGLLLCFFWRRLTHTTSKKAMATAFIVVQWIFMVSYTVIKLLEPYKDTTHMQSTLLNIGLIANIAIGVLIIGAWLRTHAFKWQPQALVMVISGTVLAAVLIFSSYQLTDIASQQILSLAAKAQITLTPKNGSESAEGFTDIIRAEAPVKLAENKTEEPAKAHHAEAPASEHQSAHVAAESKTQSAVAHEEKGSAKEPTESTKHVEEPVPATDKHHEGEKGAHWSYGGETGPTHWGELNKEYSSCQLGKAQSPIDIDRSAPAKRLVDFVYRTTPLRIIDNGHTIQTPVNQGSQILLDGKAYVLKQIHFHSPSEHTLNGVVYPVEMHFVHADDKGNLAVVGVLVEKGAENKELAKIWKNIPDEKNAEKAIKDVTFSPLKLLPARKPAFHYMGSLTTPPCTEGVKWYVLKDTTTMSAAQIKKFRDIYNNNARPVQPFGKRKFEIKN